MKLIIPLNVDQEGLCRTLKANYYKMGGANFIGHTGDGFRATCIMEVLEPIACAMRGRNPDNPSERARSNGKYKQRIEMGSNISNTITTVQKDSLIAEPQVLTPKRTDFGKQVRKQYESGELDMSRHDMTELEPRKDGVCNTLTSVQKDNLVAEPLRIPQATEQGYVEVPVGGVFDGSYPNSKTRRGRVQEGGTVAPALTASGEGLNLYEGKEPCSMDENYPHVREVDLTEEPKIIQKCGDRGTSNYSESPISYTIPANPMSDRGQLLVEPQYRIRKLTPRECYRLMGVSESDIDKIQQSGISNSQQYKMAGNSIVVDVLYYIFKNMFIEDDINTDEHGQLSMF